jgi:excisionase family DNA binding protein
MLQVNLDDLVTKPEAARLLKVSPWTIAAWLSQGKLKRIKAGGRTLVSKNDLAAFVKEGQPEDPAITARRAMNKKKPALAAAAAE